MFHWVVPLGGPHSGSDEKRFINSTGSVNRRVCAAVFLKEALKNIITRFYQRHTALITRLPLHFLLWVSGIINKTLKKLIINIMLKWSYIYMNVFSRSSYLHTKQITDKQSKQWQNSRASSQPDQLQHIQSVKKCTLIALFYKGGGGWVYRWSLEWLRSSWKSPE